VPPAHLGSRTLGSPYLLRATRSPGPPFLALEQGVNCQGAVGVRIAKDGWIFAQAVTARFAKATPFASGPNTVTLTTAIATATTPIAMA
jgi:hypothetical protein